MSKIGNNAAGFSPLLAHSGHAAAIAERQVALLGFLEKCRGVPAPQLPAQDRVVGRTRLGNIETDRRNRLHSKIRANSRMDMSARHEAVGQCLHESDKRVFFCIRQAQLAHEFGVHVVGRLRGWPACRSFTGLIELAARQDVPRVIVPHAR